MGEQINGRLTNMLALGVSGDHPRRLGGRDPADDRDRGRAMSRRADLPVKPPARPSARRPAAPAGPAGARRRRRAGRPVDDLELDGVEPDRDIDANAPAPQVTALLSADTVLATRIFGGAPPRSRLQEIPWKLVSFGRCDGGATASDRHVVRCAVGGALAARLHRRSHPGGTPCS